MTSSAMDCLSSKLAQRRTTYNVSTLSCLQPGTLQGASQPRASRLGFTNSNGTVLSGTRLVTQDSAIFPRNTQPDLGNTYGPKTLAFKAIPEKTHTDLFTIVQLNSKCSTPPALLPGLLQVLHPDVELPRPGGALRSLGAGQPRHARKSPEPA